MARDRAHERKYGALGQIHMKLEMVLSNNNDFATSATLQDLTV